MNDGIVKLAEQALIEVYDCAQENPVMAETFDKLHKEKFNVSIRDNAKTVLEKTPTCPCCKRFASGWARMARSASRWTNSKR